MKKFIILIFSIILFLYSNNALAADGSGTNTVVPTSVYKSSTGNTEVFTFTASEIIDSGEISIAVPSGWSAPQGTPGIAGYTTASSASGMVAKVEDAADSTTGWSAGTACSSGLSLDTTVKHEGVGSVKCANGNENSGDVWYRNFTAENWSSYTRIGFWFYSSLAITAGRLNFAYDDSANLASPIEEISVGGISANTWTYIVLNFGATTRTSVASYGFIAKHPGAIDNATIYIDDILIGPGVATFPGGQQIRARLLQLSATQTVTVTYGSGGGTSGATAPATAGTYIFTTQSRASDSGTLTNIAASPSVEVLPFPVTQFSLSDPGNMSAGSRLGYTVTRKDQYGDVVTSGTTTVYLYSNSTGLNKKFYNASTGGSVITSIVIGSGTSTANFWYYDELAGTYTITASDSTPSPDGATGIVDATDSVTVLPASTYQFFLDDPGNMTAGSRLGYVVTRKDQYNNLVTTGSNIVYLYSNSAGVNKKFYDAASDGNIITSVIISSGNSDTNFWYYDELAGTYTITASDNATAPDGATGIADATDSVTVSPGSIYQFTLDDPGNMTAGNRLGYIVTRKDQYNNVVTSGSNTVYLYSNSTGLNKKFYNASTGGSVITSIVIGSGTSTANFWYYDELAGTYTITASDSTPSPDGATGIVDATDSVTVSPGSVYQFTLDDPGNMTAGTRLGYVVTRKDQYGNLVVSGSNTVYLYSDSTGLNKAFYNAGSGGSVITSITIGSGTSTANFWYYDELAGTFTITASDNATAPDGATGIADATDSVTVLPAPVSKFILIDFGDMTAGTKLGYTVVRKDTDNNLVFTGTTTVYLYSDSTGLNKQFYDASAGGNVITSLVIGEGASSSDFWYYDELAGTFMITVSDNATAPDGTAGTDDAIDYVTVFSAAISQFSLDDPGNMTAGDRLGYVVSRKDQYSNLITSTTSETVYLYSSSSGANKAFYNVGSGGSAITSVVIGSGTSTANFWYYDELAGSYTITASDSTPSPDGVTGIDDAAEPVTVSPASVSYFILNDPGDITAGNRADYTVIRKDQYGNLVVSGNDTVYLYSNSVGANKAFYDAAVGGNIINYITIGIGNSSADFWYYDELAGTYTITASDSTPSPDGATGIADATDSVTVLPSAISQFVLNDPGNMTAGTRLGYTVTRKDQYGNLITSGANTVYLYSDSLGVNKKFYNASTGGSIVTYITISAGNSFANFWYYDELAGTYTITASDKTPDPDGVAGIDDAVDSVTVSPASVYQFFLDDPGDMTIGTRLGYTATRKDQYGNLVISGILTAYLYSDSLGLQEFYNAGSGGIPISSVSFVNGSSTAVFWYYDESPGTWTITVSDNATASDGAVGIIDANDSVTVLAAPITATKFIIIDPLDGIAGSFVTVTVRAQDDSGNTDTTYQNDVTLVASGSASGGGLVDIVNGVGTINITDNVAETVDLSLSDTELTGLNVSSTQNVVFAAGPVSQFILNDPGNASAGERTGYTVTRKDQYGNLVIAGNTTVYLHSNSTGPKNFYDTDTGGNIITSIVIGSGNSVIDFWYYDEKAGNWIIDVSDNSTSSDGVIGIDDDADQIAISPGPVSSFVLNNPGDLTAGNRAGYTVTRKDEFSNLVISGSDTVYLYSNSTGTSKSFYNSPIGGSAITFITISDGISANDFWYYDELAGSWTITASDNASAPDGTAGIDDGIDLITVTVVPIVATKFVILDPPNSLVGSLVVVSVQAQDDSDNIDTSYQNDITLVASGSATGEGLIDIVNGVGSKVITDSVVEIVVLSLSDTEGTGLDISSVQNILFYAAPAVSAALPSAPPSRPVYLSSTVSFSGRTFPGGKVSVISQDLPIGYPAEQETTADENGGFVLEFRGVAFPSEVRTFGLLAEDKNNRTAQSRIYNIDLRGFTRVENIILPPTVGFQRLAVTKGDLLNISGYASPLSEIQLSINGEIAQSAANADENGFYKISYNTGSLPFGTNTARVRQVIAGKTSDFSGQKAFTVSKLLFPGTDLNGDNVIDIKDLSIFLSKWNSGVPSEKEQLDLNGDGIVDTSDFSIFIRTLKGQ